MLSTDAVLISLSASRKGNIMGDISAHNHQNFIAQAQKLVIAGSSL